MLNSDFIITLAWPEGKIASVGSWYDKILGLNRKYKIGHTAVILINSLTKKVYYYDFGRYDTPNGTGRVRNYKTDPELNIKHLAIIKNNKIINLSNIILEIAENKATYGEGTLYYKVLNNINASYGIEYAKKQQDNRFISFGPFSNKSLNCGRFVYEIIEKSTGSSIEKIKVIVNDLLLRIPLIKKISILFYFENIKIK
jgi:hypothetical protein|tara:strand:- start:287 stop:883 length:597 start_codon:yes stop_codon:yes gene_type:complete